MTKLGTWLKAKLQEHGLTQNEAAVYAGVASATISEILNKDHVPKVETLFRLADYFQTSREYTLRLVGYLPTKDLRAQPGDETDPGDALIQELVDEFRRVPDEWKAEALAQVRMFVRLANRPPLRIIGDDEPTLGEKENGGL